MRTDAQPPGVEQVSEMLILPDGKIFVHNLTPTMARLLVELDPADTAMLRRAGQATANLPPILPAL